MVDLAAARDLFAGKPKAPEAPPTSFADVVRAHWKWQGGLRSADGTPSEAATAEYTATVAAFERREGTLAHAYWSTTQASGVAVTIRHPPRVLRWLGKEPDYRFHLASDWAIARPASPLAAVFQRCHLLAIRGSEVLRGSSERIAMASLFSVASHLFGFIDRCDGAPTADEAAEVVLQQTATLDEITEYYERAANRAARLVYSAGMMLGFLWVLLIAGAVALLFWAFGVFAEATLTEAKMFFACYALGALGAFVSVMSRMAQPDKFTIDADVGRNAIRRLAAFRPILGGIFGVVAFLVVKSGVLQIDLQQFEFYIVATAAFVAGFSERWTRMALERAGGRFTGGGGAGEQPQPPVTEKHG